MKNDMICCSHCKGTGRVALTGVYAETLRGLRRLTKAYGYCVANQHAKLFGCNATALCNRLAALERLGFATSERFGRERRFRASAH